MAASFSLTCSSKDKMKIGFDAKRAFHNFRGLGNYSRTTIEGLCKYYPEHQYYLYTPPINSSSKVSWRETIPATKIIEPSGIFSKALPSLWRSLAISSLIIRDNLDIYHGLSHELPVGIEKFRGKKIVTIHDLLFMRYPQNFATIDRIVYKKKFLHSCHVADQVVAICGQTQNDIIEYLNVPTHKIKVVYQGCNPIFFKRASSYEKELIKKKYNLPSQFLLYVGALEPNKNALSIIKALSIVNDKNISLAIIGKGERYKKILQAEISKKGLGSRVIFLGNGVETAELPAIYQSATAMTFPSFFEGLGLPVIEALASELPVITSQGYSLTEAGGPDTIYIEPHSKEELAAAIDRVSVSGALRATMAQRGRSYVEQFSIQNCSDNLFNLYRS